ncbi:MAG: C45 family peptidase [Anaerolineales bacterium]|jgi:predicted choloylglycine hydrolase|nr:C45 family peptidase [Anaerolineales bacterium]
MEKVLPFYTFSGTHRQIGRQYGEACSNLIQQNLELSLKRLQAHTGATAQQVFKRVLQYQPYVRQYAPFLDEEIVGMAEGAILSLEQAYFLQLRAEIESAFSTRTSHSECTSFMIRHDASADGQPLAGQNADLPAFYADMLVVMEVIANDLPAILMVIPAGQVSYLGMNQHGLCAFANYISCTGWRPGFPRYFLSRLALTTPEVHAAQALLQPIYRASSRNLLLVDANSQAVDIEFAVERQARLEINGNTFVHANHFDAPVMGSEETSSPKDLHNSHVRLKRLQELLAEQYGQLDAAHMQEILRDRVMHPDPLSIEPGDDPEHDYITVCSIIAEPLKHQLWATAGPPSLYPYQRYSFRHSAQTEPFVPVTR